MRNTRKWLVLLLTVVMLVNTLGITAMAAEDESPIALALVTGSGSKTQVQILATEAQTVADGKLVLTYDEALTWLSAEHAAEGVMFTLTFDGIADAVVAVDGTDSYITGVDADLAQQISTCYSARFRDLDGLYPIAHTAVDFMVANGYMYGMSETSFGPLVTLNRAMMVTILYSAAGRPAVEDAPVFTDVPADAYFAAPVAWAAKNGITSGVGNNLFAPGKSLTRTELVTFLYAFAKAQNWDVTAAADLSAYTDVGNIPAFALKPFQWAVANGIVAGTSATTLSPEAVTNRLQVSMMVYRLLSAQE